MSNGIHLQSISDHENEVKYIFRSKVVLSFSLEHKRQKLMFGEGNSCYFVDEDYLYLSNFLKMCYDYSQGNLTRIDMYNYIAN